MEVTDIATLTAILYAARLQRRMPETEAEKQATIFASLADAKRIAATVSDYEAEPPEYVAEPPEQPPPSPGNKTGAIAEATAVRRRDEFGRWTTTGSD